MRFLGTLLLLGGYTLVYAAVADAGKFATDPWAGLFADAYSRHHKGQQQQGTGPTGHGGNTSGQTGGSSRPRTPAPGSTSALNNATNTIASQSNPLTATWNMLKKLIPSLPLP